MRITISALTIYLAAPGPRQRSMHPPVTIRHPEFQRGFYSGLQEGLHGLEAGSPVTDDEILDNIKTLIEEGAFSTEDQGIAQFSIGSIIGRIFATAS